MIEIEMHSVVGGADITSTTFAIESSHTGSYVAANAFDDDETDNGSFWTGTSWAANPVSGENTVWIGQDFDSSVDVAEIVITPFGNVTTNPSQIEIQYSDDGTDWTTTDTYSIDTSNIKNKVTLSVTSTAESGLGQPRLSGGNQLQYGEEIALLGEAIRWTLDGDRSTLRTEGMSGSLLNNGESGQMRLTGGSWARRRY